jgi:hypothetical protein
LEKDRWLFWPDDPNDNYRLWFLRPPFGTQHHLQIIQHDEPNLRALIAFRDDGALVLPDVSVGMIEASATRRPAMPRTRSWASTTAIGSDPILQVPTGWHVVSAAFFTQSRISSSVVRSAPGATSLTLKGGHRRSRHDRAGDADRARRQL